MGRITDKVSKFLTRIANRLGIKRDNLLEAGKGNLQQIEATVVPYKTIEQVDQEISAHDNFVKQLQEDAKKFDPSMMSKEEAIMKILEKEGLNSEFSKNPAAMKQISEIGDNLLQQEGIEKITKENLKDVESKLQCSNIKINDSGNMTYIETAYDNAGRIENQEKTIFSMNDQGMFEKTKRIERHWNQQEYGEPIIYKSSYTREKNIYNKYGLEMKKEHDYGVYNRNNDYYGLPQREEGRSFTIERNPDLVTATYRRQEVPNSIINNGYIDYSNQGKTIQYIIATESQYDTSKLVDYGKYDFKSDEESMRRNNENQGVVYEGNISKEERLNIFAKKSSAFKKTAEERGLIQSEHSLDDE